MPIFEFEQSWDTLAGSLKLFLVGGKEGWGGRGGEGREGSVYKTRTYIQVVKLCDSRDISRHSINLGISNDNYGLTNLNLGGNGDTAVESKCSSRLVLL